ncbi:MAG: TraR/DksA family transcriptional regulator [Acidobacteriota bacterium]
MNKTELKKFRKRLLVMRTELAREYTTGRDETLTGMTDGAEDSIDFAVNSYTKEFLMSLSSMKREQILAIEDALRRIRSGDYGICDECGESIGKKRLTAVPWAKFCLKCREQKDLSSRGVLIPPLQEAYEPDEG